MHTVAPDPLTLEAPLEGAGLVGARLGEYRVLRRLARGGMGDVFLAEHGHLDRRVAIKVARRDLPNHEFLARQLVREARALSKIEHPNVVQLYDLHIDPDRLSYLVMELLEGHTLEAVVDWRPQLPVPAVFRIAKEMARGLAAVHEAGFTCGDIKPDNVMVVAGPLVCGRSRRNWIRLFDLGTAEPMASERRPPASPRGFVLGTATYMSPEAVVGRDIDRRSDVYSLGVLMYRMLAGRLPFRSEDLVELQRMQVGHQAEPVSAFRRDVMAGGALEQLVDACLTKNPERRPADMLAFLDRVDVAEASWHR